MREYLRPWKLATLTIGLALLIVGSYAEVLPDWDVGISLIMGVLTYLTAPFVVRTIWRLNWKRIPLAGFYTWLSVDGCYWLYHTVMGNTMVREANAYASTPLFLLMGILWMWNGTLRELIATTIAAVHRRPRPSPGSSDPN